MSHFVVLVIGEDVEGQLAPFDENMEVDAYEEFWSDEDLTRFKGHYGLTDEDLKRVGSRKVQDAAKDWCGRELHKGVNSFYTYSTYNPDSKWDWYQIGGRWMGYFKPKEGRFPEHLTKEMLGSPGAFDNEPKKGWVDQIRKGDVDFKEMVKEAEAEAAEQWDKVYAAAKPWLPAKTWEEVREAYGMDRLEEAREYYRTQPAIKALKEAKLNPWFGCAIEMYMLNDPEGRAKYIKRSGLRSFIPFAVLYDGEWREKGKMGWFGCSTSKMSDDEWEEEVLKLLEGLPDDTLLTAVDCHI